MLNLKKLFSLLTIASLGLATTGAWAHSLTAASPTVTQNFDSMWDGASSQATLQLPDGWRIDRNTNAPREVRSWASAATEVMYSGGTSLASNAKNGTWNFGDSATPTDRAVGGLTTTVANGTRCINVMTVLQNADTQPISRLQVSYDIEKYRNGSNTAGFAVQLYYSADGEAWTSAGDDFYTYFSPDGATAGAEVVPISTTPVTGKNLLASVDAGSSLYLAWNISVATGTSPNQAPGLAIDNVSVTANYGSTDQYNYIYVEDNTEWPAMSVYENGGAFGSFPGISPVGQVAVNGVSYKAFEHTATAPLAIVVNDGESTRLPEFSITENRNYYLCATAEGVTEITDPENYTGWVDPDAPVPSGIYLRGEVNSWGADANWEFGIIGDGVYELRDKQLSGAFKVADANWSSSCNYGSNGSNILMDTPYQLVSGTDSNISCGSNAYTCKRIVLTITADGAASLLLESDSSTDNLTTVYVIGDNNGWNYMDASGALTLDTSDNLFKGRISLTAASDGYAHWRIYQGLGMNGAWGAESNLTGDNTSGTLTQGCTGNVSTASGTYDFSFDITTGRYSLVKVSSAVAQMELLPSQVVLVPQLPQTVKVLSLNNSLIYYNDQDAMFNEIATAMGKDASWTKHTLLGKSLETHWNEGEGLAEDGTPGAKMLVRSDAWSHIILQEQSSLPRTSIETFRASVKKWVDYIRENCPNPNAIIILPMNWAYAGDWSNYTAFNDTFSRNYLDVAQELGVVVCPVACAYQDVYEAEGEEACNALYLDDRHPLPKATYMAACMEYSLIYGEDAATITHHPESVTADEAQDMRKYASQAMADFTNYVDHNNATVRYTVLLTDEYGIAVEPPSEVAVTLDGGGSLDDNHVFTSDGTLGTCTVTATMGNLTSVATVTVAEAETEVITYPAIELGEDCLSATEDFNAIGEDAEAQLPQAWRIDRQTVAPRTLGTFPLAGEQTMYSGGENLPSNAKNGLWNFGATGSSDRALGGITTGVANGTRAINLYAHILNTSKKNLENVTVSYNIEKYRRGSNSAGFAVQLYYSIDGRNWTSAGEEFYTYLDPDSETAGYDEVPGETIGIGGTLPTVIGGMCDLYLAWNISVASGDAANAAMALGIDDFSITTTLPEIPTAENYIYAIDNTGWASLGLYAWGDGEIFGAWPGQAPIDEQEIDGQTYKVFALDTNDGGTYNLIFNNWNNGKQAPDFTITANRSYYLIVTADKVTEASGINEVERNGRLKTWIEGNTLRTTEASRITVFSLTGAITARANGSEVDVTALPSGVYIVKATAADGTSATTKVIR